MKPYRIIQSKIPLPKKMTLKPRLPRAKVPMKFFAKVHPPKLVKYVDDQE